MGNSLTIGLVCMATLAQGVDRPPRTPSAEPCEEPAFRSTNVSAEARTDTDKPCGEEIEELIDNLLDWIADHTDYDVAPMHDVPPAVTFVEAGDHFECEGEELIVDDDLQAIYDRSTRHVRIVLPWSISEPFDRSILLHEIVHDVQLNSRHWYCPEETEWEAYKLQDAWLSEHGFDSDFDWLHVYFLSRCPRDFHP